jgi:SAM-dependent methyltransferase
MVTKYLQITEDDHGQRAFAIAKAAGNQRYPRTTTTTVRESVGSGFDAVPGAVRSLTQAGASLRARESHSAHRWPALDPCMLGVMSEARETYAHDHHESVLRSHRWRTAANSAAYLLDRLVAGTDVLDVGCGPGTITGDFARRVGPSRVVGIDRTVEVVEAACRDAESIANVEFRVGDVYRLPTADATFDVVHAHQLLQHLSDPVAALVEMRRSCRPIGVVAARDSDYASAVWYPEDPALDRWLSLQRRVMRDNGANPDAGRRLLGWERRAGFQKGWLRETVLRRSPRPGAGGRPRPRAGSLWFTARSPALPDFTPPPTG